MDPSMSLALKLLIALLGIAILVVLVIAVVMLVRLLKMLRVVRDDRMPVQGKVAFWAALFYTVFPVDVLPDPVYLDDVGVMSLAMAFITSLAAKHGITGDQVRSAADKVERVGRAARPVADRPEREQLLPPG
jgi:uncharacterized membrane protein YkvA (DUF1232 family)